MSKKYAFIVAVKSRRKMDIFEANNAINVSFAEQYLRVAGC
jgi:hypothetical protein